MIVASLSQERDKLSELSMRILLVAGLCGACAFPSERVVTGVLSKIERRQDLESHCPLISVIQNSDACHIPPVCCAYRLTVRDPDGREEWFYAFWPEFMPGLTGMESKRMQFHVRRQEIVEFPCTMYGCRTFLDYALDSDADWRVLGDSP